MASVSLVMIAKNEAVNLPKCVNSLVGIFDEFILVDTGSTDDTKKVAEELGAKVFDYPEQDGEIHFAKWRNYAKDQATGEWLISIDADEWCEETCKDELRKAIETAPEDVDLLLLRSYVGSRSLDDTPSMIQYVQKVFRNKPGVKWVSGRHNFLMVPGKTRECPNVVWYHLHGVRSKEAKTERSVGRQSNIEFFEKEVEKNPKSARSLFYLGNSYRENGRGEDAINTYMRYLDVGSWDEERAQVAIYLAGCLSVVRRYDEARFVLLRGMADMYNRAELYLQMGEVCSRLGNLAEATHWYRVATMVPFPQNAKLFLSSNAYSSEPYVRLSVNLWHRKLYREASEASYKALEFLPNNRRIRRNLSISYLASGEHPFTCTREWEPGDFDVVKSIEGATKAVFFQEQSLEVLDGLPGWDIRQCVLNGDDGDQCHNTSPLWGPKKCEGYEVFVYAPGLLDLEDEFLTRVCLADMVSFRPKKAVIFTYRDDTMVSLLESTGCRVLSNDPGKGEQESVIVAEPQGEVFKMVGKRPYFLFGSEDKGPSGGEGEGVSKVRQADKPKTEPKKEIKDLGRVLFLGYDEALSKRYPEAKCVDVNDTVPDTVFVIFDDSWLPFEDSAFDVVVQVSDKVKVSSSELTRVSGSSKTIPVEGISGVPAPKETKGLTVVRAPRSPMVLPPKKASKTRTATIYCGASRYPFDGNTIHDDSYVRGSSKSAIYFCRELARAGWEVEAYTECEGCEVDGVRWKNYREFRSSNADVFVSYRRPQKFGSGFNVFYCHDAGLYGKTKFADFHLALAVSEWMSDRFQRHYPKFRDKTRVLHNGVNLERIDELAAKVAERDENLFFHHFSVDRSLLALLYIFPMLHADNSRLKLKVAGNFEDWLFECDKRKGQDRERAEKTRSLIEDGMEGVEFVGPQGEEYVIENLLRSKLCLFPNNVRESFCMAAMEAKACGTPVIASRIPALTEIAIPGSTLLLCETKGNLADYRDDTGPYSEDYQRRFVAECGLLLDDDGLWEKLSEMGRAHARGFSWAKIVERFIGLVNETME